MNLLEEIRQAGRPIALVFTSTNKVYGALEDLPLVRPSATIRRPVCAIDETRPLSFHSPYGCSKGTADQYVLDYARGFSVDATVFRMSCIYGPHQYGTEDQGWVAHFLIQALQDCRSRSMATASRSATSFTDDPTAFCVPEDHLPQIAGQAFNIGGGPENTLSLFELIERIVALNGSPPVVAYGPWRIGDQRWYVSNPRKFERATGWRPKINSKGLRRCSSGFRSMAGWSRRAGGRIMRVALVNPNWSFDGSIYFGCREPHLPLEYGYAKALLTRAGHKPKSSTPMPKGMDARPLLRIGWVSFLPT